MTSATVVGLGHVARAGKDTAADALCDRLGFTKVPLAAALKAIVYESDPDTRRIVDQVGWESAKNVYPQVRGRLQDVGGAVRRHLGEDVWIRAVFGRIHPGGRYVIPDIRYQNEAAAVLGHEGPHLLVRIDRPGVGPVNQHISERELSSFGGWSAVVANDRGIEELGDRIVALVGSALGVS